MTRFPSEPHSHVSTAPPPPSLSCSYSSCLQGIYSGVHCRELQRENGSMSKEEKPCSLVCLFCKCTVIQLGFILRMFSINSETYWSQFELNDVYQIHHLVLGEELLHSALLWCLMTSWTDLIRSQCNIVFIWHR